MSYVAIDFDLVADIGGTIVDLVQLAVSYEMNRIPSCTAVLPVGYRAMPPHTASPVHGNLLDSPLQIPISIYVTSVASGTPRVWPAGTYRIFCGWITGVGYRRTHGGYAMTIECTHWLSALSFASTLSATSHPNNPSHFIFNTAIKHDPAGSGLTHFLPRTALQQLCGATAVQNDLWGDVLYPWFAELACEDRINVLEFQALGGDGNNDSVAHEAKAALALINLAGDPVPRTLPFNLGGVDADIAAMAIADDIAVTTLTPSSVSNTMNAMAHTTFWDKIIGELSPKYFFKLIPYPERATIVPFIPGLRPSGGPWRTISSVDMSQQDMNAYLPRAIRAVGYFAGHGARSGGNLIPDDGVSDDSIGGMYVGRDDGIVILHIAPKYLSHYVIASAFSADSLGLKDVRGNAFNHPGAGTPNAVLPDPVDQKEDAKILLAELAHAMYVNELLKDRWGDIVGPVRFDISPGSTIAFEGTEGTSHPPAAGELRYGSVVRVSHFFDAQHQKCYTTFRMAHVRTAVEHASNNYTVTAHPLYTDTFVGDYNLTASATCPTLTATCPE